MAYLEANEGLCFCQFGAFSLRSTLGKFEPYVQWSLDLGIKTNQGLMIKLTVVSALMRFIKGM